MFRPIVKINRLYTEVIVCKQKKVSKPVPFSFTHFILKLYTPFGLCREVPADICYYLHSISNHYSIPKMHFIISPKPDLSSYPSKQDLRSNAPKVIQPNFHVPCCLLSLFLLLLRAEFPGLCWITSVACRFCAFSCSFPSALTSCPATQSWCAFLL